MIKKNVVILSISISIIGICIGALFGMKFANKDSLGTSKSTNDIAYLNYYSGNYFGEHYSEIVRVLNNNPIDKKYLDKLESQKGSSDETLVISEWIDAYDKELEAVYYELEEVIDSQNTNNDYVTDKEVLNDLAKMKDLCSEYLSYKHRFFEDFKLSTTGYGTELSEYIGFFELNTKRMMLFEMAELLCNWTGTISFVTESESYNMMNDVD